MLSYIFTFSKNLNRYLIICIHTYKIKSFKLVQNSTFSQLSNFYNLDRPSYSYTPKNIQCKCYSGRCKKKPNLPIPPLIYARCRGELAPDLRLKMENR